MTLFDGIAAGFVAGWALCLTATWVVSRIARDDRSARVRDRALLRSSMRNPRSRARAKE